MTSLDSPRKLGEHLGDLSQSPGCTSQKIRAERGLSQEELSFQADIHTSYVSQLERGKKSPSLRTILQIARALDTSATELMRAVEDGLSK